MLLFVVGPGQAAMADEQAGTYEDLVRTAQTGTGDVDFTALRLAYAQSPGYDPYGANVSWGISEAWEAHKRGDCAAVLSATADVLKRDYTLISVHALRQQCLAKTGQADEAARELAIARGLAQSLLSGGDGKSADTPYVVISMDEEDFVLVHFGVSKDKQALASQNGHQYDVIDGVDQTGAASEIWFDATRIFAGMQRKLEGGAPGR